MGLRVGFMGTPAFAVPTLQAIVAGGHEVPAVYTQPPRQAGRRGLTLTPSPVQVAAERLGLAVRSPINFRDPADVEAFEALGLDVGVVVAYGLLLPQAILDAPRFGCLNGHGSLLPRWRGAAPIQRAIEAGDAVTGMMVMQMEAGLDTGPVALTAETPIGDTETAGELHDRLAAMAASLMVEALAKLEAGTLTFEDQDALAARTGREPIYARKLTKAEAAIDFGGGAEGIARKINAFAPAPGAFSEMTLGGTSERVKILRARKENAEGEAGTTLDDRLLVACGTGSVRLLELQRPGGRPMPANEWLRGNPIAAGTRLVAAATA
ncbi:methionyl-tRNA formyltransferase [Aurantimonas aggregata]|uniref:Methionyl-tRNA formyltransferase n=1 Tax=Aurantimonas aggregata TaxID=2047720 RepID=A0A6L9MEE0_9HYPH|nr:methionyl-tRNA formyltransferase [Aurantimonas aggregata]NDV86209.1 methionyl-tRNA formyltransferase [Aurantimonas aggregata]